jgi:signal transduction histidine kinase
MFGSRASSSIRPAGGRGAWLASAAIAVSAAAIGLLAESVAFGWGDLRGWVPDVAVGWLFVGCGVAAMSLRDWSRFGVLMVGAGLVWFVGNFANAQSPSVDWLARHGSFVYIALLVLAALSILVARMRMRGVVLIAAASFLAVLWPTGSPTDAEVRVMALGGLVLALTAWAALRSGASFARSGRLAVTGSALLGLTFVSVGVARLSVPAGGYETVTLSFDLALCLVAGLFLVALTTAGSQRERVTDLVVELGESRSVPIRDALRRTLGDSTLEIGYRLAAGDTFVDQLGRTLSVPPENPRSVVTSLGEGMVLLHDRSLLADDQIVAAVRAAAELAATNARLQAELRAQVAELRASRRRLAIARDEGRRRLERELREGAERHLTAVADSLLEVQPDTPEAEAGLVRSRTLLSQTLVDLRSIASGLHPRVLADEELTAAVLSLAALSPVHVDTSIVAGQLDPAVESTAYFFCAEALANIAKHARASAASLSISETEGKLRVVVADDGVGGADRRGSGLRGLADRVEALGGSLSVDSPPGRGTRLAAEIQLGGQDPSDVSRSSPRVS